MAHFLPVPDWASRDHPVLRRELLSEPPRRLTRAKWLMVAGGLVLIGALLATGLFAKPAGQTLSESLSNVLFWPLVAVQIVLSVFTLAANSSFVGEQIRRQSWVTVAATEGGAELSLRARWAANFYRLRGFIVLLLVGRAVLIAAILWDLTAFQGRYLDLLANGIHPEVSAPMAAFLLALAMTGALLMPIVMIGFDAAIGLLVSAYAPNRGNSVLTAAMVVLARLLLTAALLFAASRFVAGALPVSDPAAWGLMGAFATFGDWGVSFLHLGSYAELWAAIPFGILLGSALLVFALVVSSITDRLLARAARRAQQCE